MKRLEKLLEDNNITPNVVGDYSGDHSRRQSILKVLNDEMDFNNLTFNTVTTLARSLGLSLNEFLADYEIDGTSSLVSNIKKVVQRIRNKIKRTTVSELKNNHMVIQVGNKQVSYKDSDIEDKLKEIKSLLTNNSSFIFGININKLERFNGNINNPFTFNKTDCEFIKPEVIHSKQDLLNITKANSEFWNKSYYNGKWINSEENINTQGNKIIGSCPALFVFTPLKNGADVKMVIGIHNLTGIKFTEIYGCEWLDTEDQKELAFYKAKYHAPFTDFNIENSNKELISEFEFYRGFLSQFRKFKISK